MKLSAVLALAGAVAAAPVNITTTITTVISTTTSSYTGTSLVATATVDGPTQTDLHISTINGKPFAVFKPKVVVINMFEYEELAFLEPLKLTNNITIPGLLPLYPDVHCNGNYSVCQVTTGEGEINAAASITALTLNPLFDFSQTYFMVAGIAGISPDSGSIGAVTFARYCVQVGLEYQVDLREMPGTWVTGLYPYGTMGNETGVYPGNVYGTEVFEVNANLRDRALALAQTAELSNGTAGNKAFRELYAHAPANQPPAAVAADLLTSDLYWYGKLMLDAANNYTMLLLNGTASFGTTAQEDNATLEAMLRAAKHGLVDFGRIVIMRTASDYAVPPPKYASDPTYFFDVVLQGGSKVAVDNLWLGGSPFIIDVVQNWDEVYALNTKYAATNYIGDIFFTLGGTPDFGPNQDLAAA